MEKIELTKVEIEHLLDLLELNEREGWYYGNKEHYLKRHISIKSIYGS